MSVIYTEEKSFDLAVRWLLESGIQSDEGGFYAWYDLSEKQYSYLYSEITGYGITTLLFLYSMLKDGRLIEKAKKAADWITASSLHPSGGVKTRLYQDDDKADPLYSFYGQNIFSFDMGMILYGIINLYRVTLEQRFLDISNMLAQFLVYKMQNKDGSLSPILNAKTGEVVRQKDDKWSNQCGGFHSKVSMGLVDLFRVTKERKYREAAIRLCEYALSTQENSGRFITDGTSRTTNLHPHCYTAEGLLYTGVFLSIESFVKAAKKATEWVVTNISSGEIHELYDPLAGTFNEVQRSDILAQALRLGVIFSLNHKTKDLRSVLLRTQYLGEDLKQRGGFLFDNDGQHVNSWCSMFAIQALALYENRDVLSRNMKLDLFI